MATATFSLGPQPKWYLVDNFGRPTAGFLFTYDNLNRTQFKPTFQNIGGTIQNTNPIHFAANGTAGPIYFEFDTATPNNNAYYLVFEDANHNLLYTIENYLATGSGGGGNVTTAINLKNYAGNNVFQYNIGASANPILNNTVLAPSNHENFIDPDIRYINSGTPVNDIVRFVEFLPGLDPLFPTDITPQYYLEYECLVPGAGELNKYIQLPIQPKVQTLDKQNITVTFWAQHTAGTSSALTVEIRQFFGSGTPVSPDDFTVIGAPISLTGSWARYVVTGTIPTVSGKTISPEHDDAIYLIFRFQGSATTTIDITKPSLYLGNNTAPISDFNSFQQIEALIESPRTGDTRMGMQYANYVPGGWVLLDNGTIGPLNATQPPLTPHITRNNIDTWFLYNLVWNTTTNANCPLYTSAGAGPIARGGSAELDWEADNRLALPLGLGRVFANTNPAGLFSIPVHLPGESGGEETHSQGAGEVGAHSHPAQGAPLGKFSAVGTGTHPGGGGGGGGFNDDITGDNTGGSPMNWRQLTTYIPTIMKL